MEEESRAGIVLGGGADLDGEGAAEAAGGGDVDADGIKVEARGRYLQEIRARGKIETRKTGQ